MGCNVPNKTKTNNNQIVSLGVHWGGLPKSPDKSLRQAEKLAIKK
jgi:hypothetical protein